MSATLTVFNDMKDVQVNVWLEKGPYVFNSGYDSWNKIAPTKSNSWSNRTERESGYTVGWNINGHKFQQNVVLPADLYVSHDGIRMGSRTGAWYKKIQLVDAPAPDAPQQGHVTWCWQLIYSHNGNVDREEVVTATYSTMSSVSAKLESKINRSVGASAKYGVFSVDAKLESEMKQGQTQTKESNESSFKSTKMSFKVGQPVYVYAKTYTVAVGDNKYAYQTILEDFAEPMHKTNPLYVSI